MEKLIEEIKKLKDKLENLRDEKLVLGYLEESSSMGTHVSPKVIKKKLFPLQYNSWVEALCHRLVEKGLIERHPSGWYRLKVG